jgi:prevent-host-death family protein
MQIDLQQARTHLSFLIERTMAGEEITIVHAGRAVVRMLPADPERMQADNDADSEIADLFADALGG